MIALKVVQSKYPIDLERLVNKEIHEIHNNGGFVTKVEVVGNHAEGFITSIIFEDNSTIKPQYRSVVRNAR